MLPPQSVWHIIKGGKPRIDTLEMIAKGLGVNPIEILAEAIDPETTAPYSLGFVMKVVKNSVLSDALKMDTSPAIDEPVESPADDGRPIPGMTGAEAILNILERLKPEAPPQ